jgi:membrane dipeptidase
LKIKGIFFFIILVSFSAVFLRTRVLFPANTPSQFSSDDWIEELFRNSLIIDGLLNYNQKKDPGCRKDCDLETINLAYIKGLTGVDIGSLTIPRPFEKLVAINNYVNHNQSEGGLVIKTFNDLERAKRTKKYGVIFYAQQHAELNGNVAPIEKWFDNGLRIVQIHYSSKDSPSQSPLEKMGGGCDEPDQGLTELGRNAVRLLNRLNMIIDVSHCSEKTTHDVIQMSDSPITANHANAKALTPELRNKSDSELLAIAQTGGVIGVTPIGWMIDRDGDGKGNIDDYIAHIDYMIKLVGIDHVGVASDSVLDGWGVEDRHYADALLAGYDRWKIVAWKLKYDQGYNEEDLRKIFGQNFQRLYEQVMPGLIRPGLLQPKENACLSSGDIRFAWQKSDYRGLENIRKKNVHSFGCDGVDSFLSRLPNNAFLRSNLGSIDKMGAINHIGPIRYDFYIEKRTESGYVLANSQENLTVPYTIIVNLLEKTEYQWFVRAKMWDGSELVESDSIRRHFSIR